VYHTPCCVNRGVLGLACDLADRVCHGVECVLEPTHLYTTEKKYALVDAAKEAHTATIREAHTRGRPGG
jgi:hypothetical protein